MDRSGIQRLIPIALVLVVVVIAITALVSLGRTLFSASTSGSGNSSSSSKSVSVNAGKDALTNIDADRSVSMTVRGPIVGDEDFHSYTITVSNSSRNMTTYTGYLGQQVDNDQLTNNTQAYEQFVNALSRANLMSGKPSADTADDLKGVCATGDVYEFVVSQGNNPIQELWTSSCHGSLGTLKANLSQVSRLFELQIPDYSKLVDKIKL